MNAAKKNILPSPLWLKQPSWWLVVIAGSLTIFFMVAIVRELIHGYNVRQQVARLRQQVAAEEQRQAQLQDLLEYLSSPTFQERQARLNLGLKKSGERVVIVPPGATNTDETISGSQSANISSIPARWWQYFFGSKKTSALPS